MSGPDPQSLQPAFDQQEEVLASAFAVLRKAIAQRAFPAASVAVTNAGKLLALNALGNFVYPNDAAPGGVEARKVLPVTLFDIASLTKPIATTTMAMILYERGLLELDAPVVGTMPEFLVDSCGEADPRRQAVTFRQLLAHSSGLPAYEKLFLKAPLREELLVAALTMPLSADPGARSLYSDIGFIVLGAALERITEESLDVFCQREIFGPLGMTSTTFNPPGDLKREIPPTADERELSASEARQKTPRSAFRKRIIQGEVQDENASVLGGVAGHAGLFSNAEDVAKFAHVLLSGGSPVLRSAAIELFTRRESTPAGTSRTLGWDTPSTPSQSGKLFGPKSYGHLGYTGTSLWIDPERQLSVTLLTNRTWPDCANQAIKQVRPKFHDAVIEALG